jgi:RNA polymerase sigma factor (sigma-70 family)
MSLKKFTETVLPLKNKLYRFALSILKEREEAEDVVQEALIKAWQAGQNGKEIQNLEAWIMKVTRNLSIDKLRGRRGETTNDLIEAQRLASSERDPYQSLAARDGMARIHRLLEGLPTKQRLVVHLRDIEEMSYQEISEALDMPLNQVKINLFRARQQLRSSLRKTESYGR